MTQYASDANLASRIAIHGYTVSPVSWTDWYFSHLSGASPAMLLDVGCGNANLWRHNTKRLGEDSQMHLCDTSRGMLEAARRTLANAGTNWHFHLADVEDLPFNSLTFDLAMANHMLYHARSVDAAIAELARVVVPGGALLRRHFGAVTLHRYQSSLAVPAVEPVLAYVASLDVSDTDDARRGMAALRRRLEAELAGNGQIRIRQESGLFVAHGPRHEDTIDDKAHRPGAASGRAQLHASRTGTTEAQGCNRSA